MHRLYIDVTKKVTQPFISYYYKMFKVDGFKISKIKGVVSLKSIPQSRITSLMKIDDLTKRIEEIEERMNQIIDFINSNNH